MMAPTKKLLPRQSLLYFFLNAFIVSAVAGPTASTLSPTEKSAHALVDWVNSNGGYVSDKIVIRRIEFDDDNNQDDEDDESSPVIMGVFAAQDIPQNETILKIPRNLYLSLNPDEIKDTETYQRKDATMEDIMKVYFSNTCRLAQKLIKEWTAYNNNEKKNDGGDSTDPYYGPYLAYLQTQPRGALPATYSPTGKELLRTLSGPLMTSKNKGENKGEPTTSSPNYGNYSLPPWQFVDWIDEQFVKTGCISGEDDLGYHAVSLAIQRGYDTEFIPIWDMVNHNNGKLNVETNSLRAEEGLKVWASHSIKAGKEIYATYNYCTDCYDIGDDWGTPGIYRDFGFVEDYPQIWPFLDHQIYYEVDVEEEEEEEDDDDENDDEETDGTSGGGGGELNIVANFVRNPETGEIQYGLPNLDGLKYLQNQLARVVEFDIQKELKTMAKGKADLLKPHELEMITKYHRSLIIALKAGIEATQKEMMNNNKDYTITNTKTTTSDEL